MQLFPGMIASELGALVVCLRRLLLLVGAYRRHLNHGELTRVVAELEVRLGSVGCPNGGSSVFDAHLQDLIKSGTSPTARLATLHRVVGLLPKLQHGRY